MRSSVSGFIKLKNKTQADNAIKKLFKRLREFVGIERRKVFSAARQSARETERWMKDNHPWDNVTGEAEKSITVDAIQRNRNTIAIELFYDEGYEIYNANDIPYVIFLEMNPPPAHMQNYPKNNNWPLMLVAVDVLENELSNRGINISSSGYEIDTYGY